MNSRNTRNEEQALSSPTVLPDGKGGFLACPSVMTEEELIRFLRIPEISNTKRGRNVIENLKRVHGLPRVHLCGRNVYLTDAVKQWLEERVTYGH